MKINPYIQFIFGIILTIIGIKIIVTCVLYSPPSLEIDFLDILFLFISLILKGIYCALASDFKKYGVPCGAFIVCCGVLCIIFGIRGILKDDYLSYFKKGDLPTEEELRSLLETGELTQNEYNEI